MHTDTQLDLRDVDRYDRARVAAACGFAGGGPCVVAAVRAGGAWLELDCVSSMSVFRDALTAQGHPLFMSDWLMGVIRHVGGLARVDIYDWGLTSTS